MDKIVYHYHPLTGVYTDESIAEPSPLEPGEYLIPAYATALEPMAAEPGFARVFTGDAWVVIQDNRGEVFDTVSGEPSRYEAFGALPPNLTKLPMPSMFHDFDGNAWLLNEQKEAADLAMRARSERDYLLAMSDWTQVSDAPEFSNDAWRGYRQDLRDIPEQSGFPRSIVWPISPKGI